MLFHLGFRILYGKVNLKTFQTVLEKELKEHHLANGKVLGEKKRKPKQQSNKTQHNNKTNVIWTLSLD